LKTKQPCQTCILLLGELMYLLIYNNYNSPAVPPSAEGSFSHRVGLNMWVNPSTWSESNVVIQDQWVLAARARPCTARTRLIGLIATPNGALRAPHLRPSRFAASYLTQKNLFNLSNLGRPRQGLFSFHRTTGAMKYEVHLPHAPPSQLR
jgi:hypothetical protein